MAKQRRPRRSWAETSDKLEGIVRDPDTGIVLARKHRHPLADLFRSVPMGRGLPGMQIPAEAGHLLAIHIFDNLRCSPPQSPLYKARRDKDAVQVTGMEGVTWVPITEPDPVEEAAPSDQSEQAVPDVDDISHYTPAQLAAMKAQIRQIELERKLIEQSDTGSTR